MRCIVAATFDFSGYPMLMNIHTEIFPKLYYSLTYYVHSTVHYLSGDGGNPVD